MLAGPLRWALSHLSSRRSRQRRIKDGRLAIGTARHGGACRVPFGLSRGVHALVLGATGSGKTVTQAAIAQAYVQRRHGGDRDRPQGRPPPARDPL